MENIMTKVPEMRALILEDNEDRRHAMSNAMAASLPLLKVDFSLTAREMIQRIQTAVKSEIAIISLDNDLDMIRSPDGQLIDAVDGIEVMRHLATLQPFAPVVVHTTNMTAGDQIVELLRSHDWTYDRVVPYADLRWIDEAWAPLILKYCHLLMNDSHTFPNNKESLK